MQRKRGNCRAHRRLYLRMRMLLLMQVGRRTSKYAFDREGSSSVITDRSSCVCVCVCVCKDQNPATAPSFNLYSLKHNSRHRRRPTGAMSWLRRCRIHTRKKGIENTLRTRRHSVGMCTPEPRRIEIRYNTIRYGRLTCAQKLTRWPA